MSLHDELVELTAGMEVPEYLIVDPDRKLWTLHTTPAENGYRTTITKPIDAPIDIAGVQIELGR